MHSKITVNLNSFRKTNTWLRYRVDQEIDKKHTELQSQLKRTNKYAWIEWLFNMKRWYLTVLITIAFFIIFTLFFSHFDLKDSDIASLIDQRIGNLSTITGFSLAVIAFLMGNIAVKEPYAYRIVFQKTKFYVVILCVLTTLSSFILISTFRHLINGQHWINAMIDSSGVIFVIILILIGTLFFSALTFINASRIDELVNEALISNARTIIHQGLVREYSLKFFKQLMGQRRITKYNFGEIFDNNPFNFELTEYSAKEIEKKKVTHKYISDINMTLLSAYLAGKDHKKIRYHDRFIGMEVDMDEVYIIIPDVKNTSLENNILKSFLRFSSNIKETMPAYELREHYDIRIIDYAQNGKDKELERMLQGLASLYSLQMTYQHQNEFNLTKGLHEILLEALKTSLRKKNIVGFKHLITFTSANCFKAIELLDIDVFKSMLEYYPPIFNYVRSRYTDKDYIDIIPYALDPAGFYEMFFYSISEQKKKRPENLQMINQFGYQAYRGYGLVLYYMLSVKDYKRLIKGLEILDKPLGDETSYKQRILYKKSLEKPLEEKDLREINILRKSYKESKALDTYKRHTIFGIRAWIMHLKRHKKLDMQETLELLNSIKLNYFEVEDVLDDILFFRGGNLISYFTWQSWVFPDYLDSDEFNFSDPQEWLTFGFMCEQIRRYSLPLFDAGLLLQKVQNLSFLINDLKNHKAYFIGHFLDWKEILFVTTETDLERKCDVVISFFERLEGDYKQAELDIIAVSAMKAEAIEEFKLQVAASWKEQSGTFEIFEKFEIIQNTDSVPDNFIGIDQEISDIKQFFVNYDDSGDISILNTIGAQVGRMIDIKFFDTIKSSMPLSIHGNLTKVVTQSIKELKSRGFTPDCILLEAVDLYSHDEFVNSTLYVKKDFQEESDEISILNGWYDNVPIYTTFSNTLSRSVIVSDFKSAFRGTFDTNETWPHGVLQVSVDPINHEEAKQLAIHNSSGKTRPSENEITRIQNGVKVKLGINAIFSIIDESAVIVGELL